MNKLFILSILCCISAALACDYFETGRPVIQLASIGGFVPPAYVANQIPEVKIWEDGTIIISSSSQGKRQVLQNTISTEEITRLIDKIHASDFMQFYDSYTGENAPTDMPSTCIRFWSADTSSKQVCDYFNGAPDFFQYLVIYLRTLKENVKSTARQEFRPVAGFVKSYDAETPADTKNVVFYTGTSITSSGIWITDDQTLTKLWNAANNNQVVSDSGRYIYVSVQVDDLSIANPPTMPADLRCKNNNTSGTKTTTIIRYIALGLSGFMLVFGLALLIRIVRKRHQKKQAEPNDAEVPMVETPSHAAATSTSVYEQPAAPYWAGAPTYLNTQPQYMVVYMQPTQTTQ